MFFVLSSALKGELCNTYRIDYQVDLFSPRKRENSTSLVFGVPDKAQTPGDTPGTKHNEKYNKRWL
jgi:hypothetical protein